MANTHATLSALFTAIANSIRSKTGGTGAIVADKFPDAIAGIEVKENLDAELSTQDSLIAQINTALAGKVGVALPVLSKPAGAENIEAGYQAIDGSGKLVEGTAVKGARIRGNVTFNSNESIIIAGVDEIPDNFVLHIGAHNVPRKTHNGSGGTGLQGAVIKKLNGGTIDVEGCEYRSDGPYALWQNSYTASISNGNLVLTPNSANSSAQFIWGSALTLRFAYFCY